MQFDHYRIIKNFKKKSIENLAYPSLYSKYYRTTKEYFSENFKSRRKDLYILLILPITITKLIVAYIFLLANFIFSSLNSKKLILILTRELGIKDFSSLEDYRFESLEKSVKKKDFNVFYY